MRGTSRAVSTSKESKLMIVLDVNGLLVHRVKQSVIGKQKYKCLLNALSQLNLIESHKKNLSTSTSRPTTRKVKMKRNKKRRRPDIKIDNSSIIELILRDMISKVTTSASSRKTDRKKLKLSEIVKRNRGYVSIRFKKAFEGCFDTKLQHQRFKKLKLHLQRANEEIESLERHSLIKFTLQTPRELHNMVRLDIEVMITNYFLRCLRHKHYADSKSIILHPESREVIFVRPNLFSFLLYIREHFQIVIWTSGHSKLVEPILKRVMGELLLTTPCLYGDSCEIKELGDGSRAIIKPLSKIYDQYANEGRVVIIDDTATKSAKNYKYAINPPTWEFDDTQDNFLSNEGLLVQYLKRMLEFERKNPNCPIDTFLATENLIGEY